VSEAAQLVYHVCIVLNINSTQTGAWLRAEYPALVFTAWS